MPVQSQAPKEQTQTSNMENISEFFYERLKNTTNPGVILAQFYGASLDRVIGRSEIIMLNKLIKMFGRFNVFFAVMNLVNVQNLGTDFPYGLIFKICKDYIEKKTSAEYDAASSRDLSKDIDRMNDAIDDIEAVIVDEETYKELD